jgi:energy-coupling factor transporter ATP-binding protein EcfA2
MIVSYIRLKNVQFSYEETQVFKDLNFYLPKNKTLSIIGPSGVGKTTLLRLLNNELDYNGVIDISGVEVNKTNFNIIKRYVSVVYDDNIFIKEVVKDELRYSLENMNISPKQITKVIKELNEFFNINKILNKAIESLSINDKYLVKILSYAVMKPSYLCIDGLLGYLDNRTKILLLNYLNYKEILLINVTSDMNDALYTDYTLCLYNGISAIDGKTIDVFKEEKIIRRLGLELPFMIDLSIQLQLYGLINKMYLNKEGMVEALWK